MLDLALEREEVLWENNPDVDISALNDTQQIQKELGFQDEIYKVEDILDLRFIPKNKVWQEAFICPDLRWKMSQRSMTVIFLRSRFNILTCRSVMANSCASSGRAAREKHAARALAGLRLPTEGEILLDGAKVQGPTRSSGVVFQDASLYPWRTISQNVGLGLELAGMKKRAANARRQIFEHGRSAGIRFQVSPSSVGRHAAGRDR